MTQTSNLKLNTWAADDPINLTQMNDNFQKLDTASKYVKLMEVNDTVGGATQINVNLTGIRMRDFAYLELTGALAGYSYGSTQMVRISVRLNGVSTASYYDADSTINSNTTTKTVLASVCSEAGYTLNAGGSFVLRLFPCKKIILGDTTTFGFRGISNSGSFNFMHTGCAATADLLTPDTLTQINFFPSNSDYTFIPGSSILVYGVRR